MKLGTSEELQMKQLFMIVQVFFIQHKNKFIHTLFLFQKARKEK
jgi:hypothetical protein